MLVARRWAKGGRDTAYLRAAGVLGSCAYIIGHSLGQRAMRCTLANVRLFCWITDDLWWQGSILALTANVVNFAWCSDGAPSGAKMLGQAMKAHWLPIRWTLFGDQTKHQKKQQHWHKAVKSQWKLILDTQCTYGLYSYVHSNSALYLYYFINCNRCTCTCNNRIHAYKVEPHPQQGIWVSLPNISSLANRYYH